MYEVDKDIEKPVNSSRAIYPFATMVVGDSFFVPYSDGETNIKAQKRLCAAAYKHTKKYGKVFQTSMLQAGVRVWCIDPKAKLPIDLVPPSQRTRPAKARRNIKQFNT